MLQKLSYKGASGQIEFDDKGDRKDAEMPIFTMKAGKIEPVAIIKSGKSMTLDEYVAAAGGGAAPAGAPAAAPAVEPAKAPAKEPGK